MKVMIIGHSSSVIGGYSYLINLANKLTQKGNEIIFLLDNELFVNASFVKLDAYKTYYFEKWCMNYNDQNYKDIDITLCNEAAYINFTRLEIVNAKKGVKNFSNSVTNGLLKKLFYFIDDVVDIENVDCMIYETVSSSLSYMAYHVSVKRKIPYVGWIMSRIPGRFDLLDNPFGNIDKLISRYKNIKIEDISEVELNIISEYLTQVSQVKPDYMKNNHFNMHTNYVIWYLERIKIVLKTLVEVLMTNTRNYHYMKYPLEAKYCNAKYCIKRQIKLPFISHKFQEINYNEKYFVFPLHYQPEASTGVCAPFYCNQVDVIRNIAFSLPIGTMLYVKDHPNGIGFMSLREYNQIFELPNVKYINPEANNKELISHSIGVVTITSTMGYEALLMQKPVLTLGKVFYNAHPYCNHILGYEQLPGSLQSMLHEKHDDFESVNIRFVKAYRDTNFEGVLLSEKDEDIDKVADSILTFVTREKKSRELHNG